MARLSQEQYNTLKAKGLNDKRIAELAKSKGYELPDNRDFLAKSADFVSSIFPGKQVGQAIGEVAALPYSQIQEARGKLPQGTSQEVYKTMGQGSPTPLQVGGDILAGAATVAGFKAPPVASVTGRLAQTAGLGATLSGASSVAKGEDLLTVGKEALKGGAFGLATQGFFEAIPAISKLVGSKSSTLSKGLREKNLRLSPLQKEKLNSKIDDVTGYLSKNKVKGNPQEQYKFISDKYDDVENQVQSLLKNSGKNYSKDEVIKMVKEIPDAYATEFDNPEVYDQLVSKSEKFANYITKNFTKDIPATKLNQFKRSYMKNGYNKAGDAISNEASLAIGDSLYSKLLGDIAELKPLNKEYTTVILGKKLLGKALGRNELGLIGNLVSSAGGAIAGGVIGGPAGSATGAIIGPSIGKVVGGTAARTRYAQTLETIKKIADKSSGKPNVVIPRSLLFSLFDSD